MLKPLSKLYEEVNKDDGVEEKRIKFDMNIPQDVLKIGNVFKENGYDLYVVGGSVRDALLGKEPKDWDLATDAEPDKVMDILKGKDFIDNILQTGEAFGVINVITNDGSEYEIATFREEEYSEEDKRRPDSVQFSDIKSDVKRRDLTINALFYDIDKGEIVDLVGGYDDLQKGIVRTVGQPSDRFNEDRLRKLRAIRFAARYGSDVGEQVHEALTDDNSLEGVSAERIRDEFLKGINTAKSVVHFLKLLENYGMFQWVFGDRLDVDDSAFVEEKDHIVLISNLLRKNDPTEVAEQLNKLTYSRNEVRDVTFLIKFLALSEETAYDLKKAQKKTSVNGDQLSSFADYNNMDRGLVDAFIDYELTVGGDEVMKRYGISNGPEVGKAIKKLETEKFKEML